jgi:hypothetical protein
MTALGARLGRVSGSFSGKDRAVLVLRALAAGQEPDPELRRIDDRVQARIFDRCMGLVFVANIELDGVCQGVLFCQERLAWGDTVEMLQAASEYAAHELGEVVDRRKARNWRRGKSVNAATFLYGLAEEERLRRLDSALLLVREMRSLEVVWRELGGEFGGESILLPEVEAKRLQAWEALKTWMGELHGPSQLPEEADEELIDSLRERVERAFQQLGLAERAR